MGAAETELGVVNTNTPQFWPSVGLRDGAKPGSPPRGVRRRGAIAVLVAVFLLLGGCTAAVMVGASSHETPKYEEPGQMPTPSPLWTPAAP